MHCLLKKRAVVSNLLQRDIFVKHQILSSEDFGPLNPVDLVDYVAELTELERVPLFGGAAHPTLA